MNRDSAQLSLRLADERPETFGPFYPAPNKLVLVDLFAGAGGFLTGAVNAFSELGRDVEAYAINHDRRSRDTHRMNYPAFTHLCTGIERTSPTAILPTRRADHIIGSPTCTHFSMAAAGKPVNPQLRSTGRQFVRWIRHGKPDVFHCENVPEWERWGREQQKKVRGCYIFRQARGTDAKGEREFAFHRPASVSHRQWLGDMAKRGFEPFWQPNPKHLGERFQEMIHDFRRMGYDVEWRVLNAADYAAATSRRRLFVYGVRRGSGMRHVWPAAFCFKPDANDRVPAGAQRWVGTETFIDAQSRGTSIFERSRPLKPKTIKRIVAGFFKFGLRGFMVPSQGSDTLRVRGLDRPAPTIRTNSSGEAVVFPAFTAVPTAADGFRSRFITKFYGTNVASPLTSPAPTITANGTHLGLAEAYLVQVSHDRTNEQNMSSARLRGLNEPLPTICGNRGEWAFCESFLLGQQSGAQARPIRLPAPTIATDGAIALCTAAGQAAAGEAAVDLDGPDAKAALETMVLRLAGSPGSGKPLVRISGATFVLDFFHRMLTEHELANVQSFPPDYRFAGNKTDAIWLIGNSVPPRLARALVKAHWSQNPDVRLSSDDQTPVESSACLA